MQPQITVAFVAGPTCEGEMVRARHRSRTTMAHRGVVVLALTAFLAGSIGVPAPRLPVWLAKDRSQPFPCQFRACGCANASQCWQGCCCFTNGQKLAWARKHDVDVPAFVAMAAARESDESKPAGGCCNARAPADQSCCADHLSCDDAKPILTIEEASPVEFVLAIAARQCQGHAELWMALGAVLSTPLLAPVAPACDVGVVTCAAEPSIAAVCYAPATPPPRA